MANTIEILVTAKNLTKPTFDTIGEQARAVGQKTGDEFSKGVQERTGQELPKALHEPADQAGVEVSRTISDRIAQDLPFKLQEPADRAGFEFSQAMGGRIREERDRFVGAGQDSGSGFTDGFEEQVKKDLPPKVEEPLNDLPPKAREKGQETGQQFSQGMSPLIIGAFAAAATVGPGLVLAGVGTAVTGAAALLAKSNAQVAQDYANLGQQVKTTLADAVSPITGDVDAAVMVLEQGVTQLGPQLDKLFATAGPDATELASGLTQFAEGALPGITQGLAAVAPEMRDIAADIGKLGQGIGGFIGGLGAGASGGTTAFNALAKSLSEILPDLGQTIGYLSNGLGPALADVLPLVNGAAKGIELLTSVLDPTEIQAAALAFGALFATFKVSSMAGLLADGTKFTSFLSGAAKTAPEAEGAIKSLATKGVGALGSALDLATGPLGMILAGVALLGPELGKLAGVGDHTAANVDALTASMSDAANGSIGAQLQLDNFANAMQFMANTGGATDGIKSIDTALTQLFQSNPAQAAKEFDTLSQSLEANGEHASDVAKEFPQYTKAVADAQLQSHLLGSQTNQLTEGLLTQAATAKTSADASAQTTLAALGATDGTSKLTLQLYNSLTAYSAASTGANAYGSALQAVNGVTQTLDDAQNSLAQQMLNAKTSFAQNGYSLDLNTQAGIDNRDALSQAAKSIIALGTAQYQATGDMGKANGVIQDQINQFVKNTGATGKNKDAIEQYLESLAKIPPNVTTDVNVNVNTDYAYKQVGSLMNYINSQTGFVSIGTSTGHGFGAKATGGIIGGVGAAASGGVRGSWTMVNEQGPELMKLPFGTHVFSAPDSQRMMSEAAAGAAGGSGQFELIAGPGADGAVAKMIMSLIRTGQLQIKQKAIVP